MFYSKFPSDIASRYVLLLDPMLGAIPFLHHSHSSWKMVYSYRRFRDKGSRGPHWARCSRWTHHLYQSRASFSKIVLEDPPLFLTYSIFILFSLIMASSTTITPDPSAYIQTILGCRSGRNFKLLYTVPDYQNRMSLSDILRGGTSTKLFLNSDNWVDWSRSKWESVHHSRLRGFWREEVLCVNPRYWFRTSTNNYFDPKKVTSSLASSVPGRIFQLSLWLSYLFWPYRKIYCITRTSANWLASCLGPTSS